MAKRKEVIGSGFTPEVAAQLKAREKLFSSVNRTSDQLMYMNSNGAWVRLMSSVDTLTKEEVEKLQEGTDPKLIAGNRDLAYNNVLLGGSMKKNVPLSGGISTDKYHSPVTVAQDGTITPGDLRTNTYHNYQSLGFRPTPGIESVNVESKNTYGTLREATIKLVAWTLEDLEVIQALYLRPGYSMLLEWGHSLWIDSENQELRSEVKGFDEFVNWHYRTRYIEEQLAKFRKASDNNYDAMYGYVKNFSWNFREDGGYDCTVTLISKGSILESMAITFDPSNAGIALDVAEGRETDRFQRKSVFHKFFTELTKKSKQDYTSLNNDKRPDKALSNDTAKEFKKRLDQFYSVNVVSLEMKDTGFWDNDDISGQYITLRTLLDVYNKFVAPMDSTEKDELLKNGENKKLIQFYVGQTDVDKTGDYESVAKYITSPKHFSIDPLVCILPKASAPIEEKGRLVKESKESIVYTKGGTPIVVPSKTEQKEITVKGSLGKITTSNVHDNISKFFKEGKLRGKPDDILNIYVSVYFLTSIIDDIADSTDKSQQNMTSYLKRVLSGINDVLGGVNELDLFYDEVEDLYYIVDRKITPARVSLPDNASINLVGLKSTVSKLNISSKISNEIAAQISIAAQGTGNNYKENVEALLKWNSGLIDRHIRAKTVVNTADDSSKEKQRAEEAKRKFEWFREVKNCFDEFNHDDNFIEFYKAPDYNKEGFNNLRSYHKQYCSINVLDEYFKGRTSKKPVPGVIPIELSFDTIGIGGLKIGQAFPVEKGVLPEVYTTQFGFLITGLAHSIQDNKWITSIKTQFFNIGLPTEVEKVAHKENSVDTIPEETPETTITEEVVSDTGTDWAPIINKGKVGSSRYDSSPLAQKLRAEFRLNGLLDQTDANVLVFIGENQGASKRYMNPNHIPEYMLHPIAYRAWRNWRETMKALGISYQVSSAYRNTKHQGTLEQKNTVATPGKSAHGWGGTIDLGDLNVLVGGSGDPAKNLEGRKTDKYKKIAEIGAKYGFYNPWRLSDNSGTDELWHFEYWGPV